MFCFSAVGMKSWLLTISTHLRGTRQHLLPLHVTGPLGFCLLLVMFTGIVIRTYDECAVRFSWSDGLLWGKGLSSEGPLTQRNVLSHQIPGNCAD